MHELSCYENYVNISCYLILIMGRVFLGRLSNYKTAPFKHSLGFGLK